MWGDKIEYDVTYQTNNLGFIDTKDYLNEAIPGKNYYAFIGDSFTAGTHAGFPWVPELREKSLMPKCTIWELQEPASNISIHFCMM